MARYLETAEEARKQIQLIVENVLEPWAIHLTTNEPSNPDKMPKDFVALLVKNLATLYNLGIRTNPRPAQHTVRLNAVRAATKGFPVKVRMEEKDNGRGGTYNALIVETDA